MFLSGFLKGIVGLTKILSLKKLRIKKKKIGQDQSINLKINRFAL